MATGTSRQEELNRELREAARVGDLSKVIRCLNDGADINNRNDGGYTALHGAAWKGHDSVVTLLCSRKADVNIKTNDGWTPLHLACYKEHENVVISLLNFYADVNIKSNDGNTPLDYALRYGRRSIAEIIKNSDLRILQAAMKEGIVSSDITKCFIQGPARAGKTSIKSMILEIQYDELSTGCIEDPHIAIGTFAQSSHLQWLKVDEKDMTDKVTAELKAVATEIKSKPSYTQQRPPPTTITTTSTTFTPSAQSTTSSHIQKQTEMGRQAESAVNELLDQSSKSDSPHMAGLGQHKRWLYFIDSGGQIQFQKLLQAFVPCASVLLLVVNLAEDFSSPSCTVMRCPDGSDVRISDDSIPVEDLLQQLIAFVTSTAQGQKEMIERDPVLNQVIQAPSNLSVITVGTHRDEYDEKCAKGEKVESIEEKEAKLSQILSHFDTKICYTDKNRIIHQVDGRKAKSGDYDDDVIKLIEKELQDKSYKVDVPLKWHCLSLILRKLAINSYGVLSVGHCYEVGSFLNLSPNEVTSALKFFHILNSLLYYPDSSICDLVFVIPHRNIIKIISELMNSICSYRADKAVSNRVKAMALEGKISQDTLIRNSITCRELSNLFPSFESKLLQLFVHLLVAAKDSNDQQYFIPALLPVISSSGANPFCESIPLLYYFPNGSPMGLFCAVIIDILSQSPAQSSSNSWSIVTNPKIPTYSNRIILSNNSMNGNFAIIEKLYWFEVVCEDSRYQKAIRKAVDVAIARVISKRNLSVNIKPQKAFICPCGNITATHVCITSVNNSTVTVTCSYTKSSTKASINQSSWFDDHSEGSNLYSKPRIGDLMRLLVPVAPQYSTIGTCLHVPMSRLGLDPRVNHQDNLRTTLQWWMDNGDNPSVNSPVTWDNIITVIERPVQNYELSQEIKRFAMSAAAVREMPNQTVMYFELLPQLFIIIFVAVIFYIVHVYYYFFE